MIRLQIKKLFENRHYSLDLTDPCTIFIAENGAGKSTVLRIIAALFGGKFIDIAKVNFQKIVLSNTEIDKTVELEYNQLFPDKDEFYFLFQSALKEACCDDAGESDFLDAILSSPKSDSAEYFSDIIRKNLDPDYNPLFCRTMSLFYNLDSFFSDLVKKVSIILFGEEIGHDKMFYYNPYEYKRVETISRSMDLNRGSKITTSVDFRKICFDETKLLEFFETVNKQGSKCQLQWKDGDGQRHNRESEDFGDCQLKQTTIEGLAYFFEDFATTAENVIRFNYDAFSFYKPLLAMPDYGLKQPCFFEENERDFFADNLEFIKDNIMPYLIEGSFFHSICLDFFLPAKHQRPQGTLALKALMQFVASRFDRSDSMLLDKLHQFKGVLEKYFTNKKIVINDGGLSIYDINNNFIHFENLSQGERKILSLFTHLFFFESSLVVLDEPEVSMSILWQEDLFSDIISVAGKKKIIAATHAPSIARKEEVFSKLKPFNFITRVDKQPVANNSSLKVENLSKDE